MEFLKVVSFVIAFIFVINFLYKFLEDRLYILKYILILGVSIYLSYEAFVYVVYDGDIQLVKALNVYILNFDNSSLELLRFLMWNIFFIPFFSVLIMRLFHVFDNCLTIEDSKSKYTREK